MRDGDRIRLDVANGTLDVLVDEAEFEARKVGFEPLPPRLQDRRAGQVHQAGPVRRRRRCLQLGEQAGRGTSGVQERPTSASKGPASLHTELPC